MIVSQAKVAAEFLKFRKRMAQKEEWPTPLAKALCLALVDYGIGPGGLANRLGKDHRQVWKWYGKGELPNEKNISEIENVLGLPAGELEEHIPEGERTRVSRERLNRVWKNRRKNYPKEEFKRKILAGDFHGGIPPMEAAHLVNQTTNAPLRGPDTLQARLRKAIARTVYGKGATGAEGVGYALCSVCRKVLCRPKCFLRWENQFHADCWRMWRRKGHDPHVKKKAAMKTTNTPSLDQLIPYWLEHHVLGLSYGKISVKHGGHYNYRAVAEIVRRANGWLPEYWGQLFPAKTRSETNVHKLLRDYSIAEVVEIARGRHSLSKLKDISGIPSHASQRPLPEKWEPGEIVDTPLARLVADSVHGKYSGNQEASRAIGIWSATLDIILYTEPRYLWGKTWEVLAQYFDKPVDELKAMLIKTGKAKPHKMRAPDSPVSSTIVDESLPLADRIQVAKDEVERLEALAESGATV